MMSVIKKLKLRIDVITYVLSKLKKCSRVKLMSLLYFVDRELVHKNREPLFNWVLWWYGPFSRDVLDVLELLENLGLIYSIPSKYGKIYVLDVEDNIILDKELQEIIDQILNTWSCRKLSEILEYIYNLDEIKKTKILCKLL